MNFTNNSLCAIGPHKTTKFFLEYISIELFLTTLNYVLRVFRHVKTMSKSVFKTKGCFLQLNSLLNFMNNSLCTISPNKTI